MSAAIHPAGVGPRFEGYITDPPVLAPGERLLSDPAVRGPNERFITDPPVRGPSERFITDPVVKGPEDRFITDPPVKGPDGFITDQPVKGPDDRFITDQPVAPAPGDRFLSAPPVSTPLVERREPTAGDHALRSLDNVGNFFADLWDKRYMEAVGDAGDAITYAGEAFYALLFGDDAKNKPQLK